MFVGIDHGTTSMRFASSEGHTFNISRQVAADMTESELLSTTLHGLDAQKDEIKMIAITYSMGDAISNITPIDRVPDRGIISRDGAGLHVGGGTQVFDTIKGSGIPAIVIPGLHRGNTPDARFNIFSHGASPEKIGIVYFAFKQGYNDLIVSDISSNTVTLAVADGRLLGGIDACIFAPGIHHGPLDLAAIRDVDAGLYNANEAFTRTGVIKMTGNRNIHELIDAFESGDEQAALAFDTLALFASMEIVSMKLLLKEKGNTEPRIFLSGSISELQYVKEKISKHVDSEVESIGEWSAAKGCALIAKDVYNGARDILGIKVD
ncbi:MAG: methanogenesis marker 12 protein [Methanosarcinales archaeon]|nr:methanogenesis marker 12 protein [Methanosarcinales archaeon]